MGIVLGLTAALSWGLADYFAAVASRRAGSFRVVLGFHLVAVALLALLLVRTGETLSDVSSGDLAWFVFLGLLGALSYLCFYRALAIGPISIVSPIVSAYAAATVVCAVVIGGERLGAGRRWRSWSCSSACCSLPQTSPSSRPANGLRSSGSSWHSSPRSRSACSSTGSPTSVRPTGGSSRSSSPGGFRRSSFSPFRFAAGEWRFPDRSPRLLVAISLIAVVDTLGYVAFNFGVRHADTTVVATAAAPYSVVPIVFGVVLLHERPRWVQWAGIGLVIGGLILLGLFA